MYNNSVVVLRIGHYLHNIMHHLKLFCYLPQISKNITDIKAKLPLLLTIFHMTDSLRLRKEMRISIFKEITWNAFFFFPLSLFEVRCFEVKKKRQCCLCLLCMWPAKGRVRRQTDMGNCVDFPVIHIYVLLSYPTEWEIIKLIFQVSFKIMLCFVIGYF